MHKPRSIAGPRSTAAAALAMGVIGTLALAGCTSNGGDPAAKTESVTLTMSWWGNDERLRITQAVIDAFEADHPGIKIEGSSTEGSAYWDKLSTQIAANDAPDIIQMDEKYLATYAERGALLDLSTTSLDTSGLAEGMVEAGQTSAGLAGVPGAINTPVVVINPALFAQAGVAIPDDSTWTWEEYQAIAEQITEATDGAVIGSADYFSYDYPLSVWVRQRGLELYDADGGLGVGADVLADWYRMALEQSESGGVPDASTIVEGLSLGISEGAFATSQAAMVWVFSNQVGGLVQGLGSNEVQLLTPPSLEGHVEDADLWYRPSVFWSVDSRTEHPEEVAEFLDFLINSPEAGEILGTDRGIPSNTEVLASVRDSLDDANLLSVDYVERIADLVVTGPPAPPEGLGTFAQILQRNLQTVLFGTASPEDAAAVTVDEALAASQ